MIDSFGARLDERSFRTFSRSDFERFFGLRGDDNDEVFVEKPTYVLPFRNYHSIRGDKYRSEISLDVA